MRLLRPLALALVAAVLASACGGDDAPTGAGPAADRGQRLAGQLGCANCHSTDGSSGVGPTWEGLAGSEVRLDDGTTVTADTEYLTRAIEDPGAEVADGYSASMPDLDVDPDDLADLVAYIESLSP